jgi:hypothetical protein
MRRSALDFVGEMQSISLPQLSAILDAASQPLFADFAAARFIQLYLYAHRVCGWNLAYTDFGLSVPNWSGSKVATSASRLRA